MAYSHCTGPGTMGTIENNDSLGCACFSEIFWQFSSELTKTWSSGVTECRVWIGNCNVKVWQSTEHKLHKISCSLKFCTNSGKWAHPSACPCPCVVYTVHSVIYRNPSFSGPCLGPSPVQCEWVIMVTWGSSPHVNRRTDTTENMTFPQLCWRTIKLLRHYVNSCK